MDISSYPKLVKIDESLKKLDPLYTYYGTFKEMMDEWSKKPWDKIEYRELEDGRKFFQSQIRELKDKYSDNCVFTKLLAEFEQFKKQLPLINTLKENSYFKENHWERLLKLIDQPIEGVDFGSITLE